MLPEKKTIALSFASAAKNYQQQALVQKTIAKQLAVKLPIDLTANLILDAGCGSGFAKQILSLKYPEASMIAVDLAMAMLQENQCQTKVCADIEKLPFTSSCCDLYWSSLSWQWCDLSLAFAEAVRCLKPNGFIAVAGLVDGTFVQINQAFNAINSNYQHTLDFVTYRQIEQLAEQLLSNVNLEIISINCYFPDLNSLFSSIRNIGANQLGARRQKGLLSRQSWQGLQAYFETLRQAEGLPLTYQVYYLYGRK